MKNNNTTFRHIALGLAYVTTLTICMISMIGCSALQDAFLTPAAPGAQADTARPAVECPGIELMGLYKNEIFDRAMGGGVVEWLAKIRNNTAVTKIVVIGWRDMYGQQQKTQVQIRGGDIASPRIDMTPARAIPPVTDLRILSCE